MAKTMYLLIVSLLVVGGATAGFLREKASGVILRVMTVGGDAVADPQYRGTWIETR